MDFYQQECQIMVNKNIYLQKKLDDCQIAKELLLEENSKLKLEIKELKKANKKLSKVITLS
jgi:hypothetical protein